MPMKANCLGVSVTGGYVYRGANKAWDGKYIFGDWSKSFGAMDGQLFFGTKVQIHRCSPHPR